MDRKSTVKEIEHIIISIVNCIFFSTFFVTFVFSSHVSTKELFTTFLVFESHFFHSMFQRNWFIICIKTKQFKQSKRIFTRNLRSLRIYNWNINLICVALQFFHLCVEPTNIWRSWQNSNIKQENVALLSSGFGHSTLITNQHNNNKYAENDTQVEDYITSFEGS